MVSTLHRIALHWASSGLESMIGGEDRDVSVTLLSARISASTLGISWPRDRTASQALDGWMETILLSPQTAKKCQCSSTRPLPLPISGHVPRTDHPSWQCWQGLPRVGKPTASKGARVWTKGCAGFIARCGVCQFHISTAPAGAAYPDGIPVCRWGDELMMAG